MPLLAVIEALENVEASHHDLYTETDTGLFVLDIEGEIAGQGSARPPGCQLWQRSCLAA